MNKEVLLKVAEEVRKDGITTGAAKNLMKKASEIKIVTLLAAINKAANTHS